MVIVGRIGAPLGVQGLLRIASFTDPPANLLAYRPWHIRSPAAAAASPWQLCDPVAVEPRRTGYAARFPDICDRDAARDLSGCDIGVPDSALPALDEHEFYWRDLIGLQVETTAGVTLGHVRQILRTGAHDVLVIRGEAEVLIPFQRSYVIQVGLASGRMLVDWEA